MYLLLFLDYTAQHTEPTYIIYLHISKYNIYSNALFYRFYLTKHSIDPYCDSGLMVIAFDHMFKVQNK